MIPVLLRGVPWFVGGISVAVLAAWWFLNRVLNGGGAW